MDKKIIAISMGISLLLCVFLYMVIGAVNKPLIERMPYIIWGIYSVVNYYVVYLGLMQCQTSRAIIFQPRRRQ